MPSAEHELRSSPSPQLHDAITRELDEWKARDAVRRLWEGDATLWTGGDESRWLGWLRSIDGWRTRREWLDDGAALVRGGPFRDVVVLGMGGSSLCPEVFSLVFAHAPGFPRLRVLDSTVPAQVAALQRQIDPARTLFVVSSKSGSTIESSVLQDYFLGLTRTTVGARAGEHFVAITDPDSGLARHAAREGYRSVFLGTPSIGGRFSALSSFGLVPAALAGLDVRGLLERAEGMIHSCAASVPPAENPGVRLGVTLGVLAREGRDKITFVVSPRIAPLAVWLEQLIAESTGKQGKGVLPVADESLAPPEAYGSDRVFVYLRCASEPSDVQDRDVERLERTGQPVLRIEIAEPLALAAEMFRWELATAVIGAVLGIHPFDQPDVEAAKIAARALMTEFETRGSLPDVPVLLAEDGLRLHADPRNATELGRGSVEQLMTRHLARLRPDDYFAIHAYVAQNAAHTATLQSLRHAVRDARQVATTLGFGPRFLHSTGQLHKGGPNQGVFLQVTADDATDLVIPGRAFSFGVLKSAQAQGDFAVLAERGRRALRVHLGADVEGGLERLRELVVRAARS